jgi:serine/threonine protein kinase
VRLGVHKKTGEKRAIKIINKKKYWNTNTLEKLEREVDILKGLKHPNIISILDMFASKNNLYIVLEL